MIEYIRRQDRSRRYRLPRLFIERFGTKLMEKERSRIDLARSLHYTVPGFANGDHIYRASFDASIAKPLLHDRGWDI